MLFSFINYIIFYNYFNELNYGSLSKKQIIKIIKIFSNYKNNYIELKSICKNTVKKITAKLLFNSNCSSRT
jgi:hypothetical protein